MIYLATPSTVLIREAVRDGRLGALLTPDSWAGENRPHIETFCWWAADNACFAKGNEFDGKAWLAWLKGLREHVDSCLFAVLPDVVGGAEATEARSLPYAERVAQLGYPVAWVLQEGCSTCPPPWHLIDAVFIGGLTEEFKFGEGMEVAMEAKRRGLWTHMGRVNSFRRLRSAALDGIQSADGTYLAFGPDKNLVKLLVWLRWLDTHMPLHLEGMAD